MKDFKKINCGELKAGMRFSAPVFFDDGENMFLAEGKSVKPYHLAALVRWQVPFLLTYGHLVSVGEASADENSADVEELEDADELEPADSLQAV
jgi:hypothetical protein